MGAVLVGPSIAAHALALTASSLFLAALPAHAQIVAVPLPTSPAGLLQIVRSCTEFRAVPADALRACLRDKGYANPDALVDYVEGCLQPEQSTFAVAVRSPARCVYAVPPALLLAAVSPPTPAPTPARQPTPAATPSPNPTGPPTAEPTASPQPTAAPTPTTEPTPAPTPTAQPTSQPTPPPSATPTPSPTSTPVAVVTPSPPFADPGLPLWPLVAAAAALLLAALGGFGLVRAARRRPPQKEPQMHSLQITGPPEGSIVVAGPVTFIARTDPPASAARVRWSIPTQPGAHGEGPAFTHTFDATGVEQVVARLDDDGLTCDVLVYVFKTRTGGSTLADLVRSEPPPVARNAASLRRWGISAFAPGSAS
jgi:hypothetical protein